MPAVRSPDAPPGARAVARYVWMSAPKARRVVDLIRGLPAREALTVLQFAPQRASVPVYKVVASAIANAENNEGLDPDSLLISQAYVDEGPTAQRWRPRAQMRPGRIRKRSCHITVEVEAVQPTGPARRRPKKRTGSAAQSGAGAAGATAAEATEAPAKKSAGAAKKAPAKQAATEETAAKKTAAKKTAAKKAPAEQAADQPGAEEGTE